VVGSIEREERVIGFDARVVDADDWSSERKALYLLRSDAKPRSLDPMVWPSIFDNGSAVRPAWFGPFQELWEDLAVLQKHLGATPEKQKAQLVAFTVHATEDGGLAEFLDAHVGHLPSTGETSPLPPTTPPARDPAWRLLGYDVCDVWGLSGLSNCGYDANELAGLRQAWAPRLNAYHLLSNLDEGETCRRLSNERVPEHAPFFVYGLWSIE